MKKHFGTKTPNIDFFATAEKPHIGEQKFYSTSYSRQENDWKYTETIERLIQTRRVEYNHYSPCFTIREGWGTEDGEEAGSSTKSAELEGSVFELFKSNMLVFKLVDKTKLKLLFLLS